MEHVEFREGKSASREYLLSMLLGATVCLGESMTDIYDPDYDSKTEILLTSIGNLKMGMP
jgi:hypothetical protein